MPACGFAVRAEVSQVRTSVTRGNNKGRSMRSAGPQAHGLFLLNPGPQAHAQGPLKSKRGPVQKNVGVLMGQGWLKFWLVAESREGFNRRERGGRR